MNLIQIYEKFHPISNQPYPFYNFKRTNGSQGKFSLHSKSNDALLRCHLKKHFIPHLEFQGSPLIVCITFFFVYLYSLPDCPYFISRHLQYFGFEELYFPYFIPTDLGIIFPPIQCFVWSHTNRSLVAIIVCKLH